MPDSLELPLPAKGAGAGFDGDRAGLDLGEDDQQLIAHHAALENNTAAGGYSVKLKHVLGDIDGKGFDRHGGAPSFPQALILQGGRESRPSH